MNFLEEVKSFCKSKLRSVDTRLRTPDGREFIEHKDSDGVFTYQPSGRHGLGYVGDVKPDLQVAIVIPGLSLGSQDVAHEFGLLKMHHITHILNVATGIPNTFENSFTYKKLDILDLPDTNIRSIFDECFQFIDDGINSGGHVFVHCNAGISRSATIVIAYLMKKLNLSYVEAQDLVKRVRPVIRPNYGFARQLKECEAELLASQ